MPEDMAYQPPENRDKAFTDKPDTGFRYHSTGYLKLMYLLVGSITLGLGLLAFAVPVLPSTPFLLISAFCYARSSQRLYNWLHTNRWFGNYLCRYQNKQGIPLRVKLSSLALLWGSIAVSAFVIVPAGKWWLYIILLLSGFGVSLHLLLVKTDRKR